MPLKSLTLAALTALALAACGRDATAPGARLSAAEAQALAASMAGLSSNAVGSASAGHAGIASSPAPVSWTFSGTFPCPAGGTVAPDLKVTGSIDATAHTSSFDFTGTNTYASCAQKADTATITVSGTLTTTAHLAFANLKASAPETFTQKGGFDWSKSDGTKGSCSVDMSGTLDPLTRKFTLAGTFCGHALS